MIRSHRGQRDLRTNAARTKGSAMVRRTTTRWAGPNGRKARAASIGAIRSTTRQINKHYRITQRLHGMTSVTHATWAGRPFDEVVSGSTGTTNKTASTDWTKSRTA